MLKERDRSYRTAIFYSRDNHSQIMPKQTSEEIYQALNGQSSKSAECYNFPPGMMEQIVGGPFTEKEKRSGKILTYKQLCAYMKTVRIRNENHRGELAVLRYEHSALK